MTRPTVFISHRHADKAIAQVVAEFLHERSSGAASIYCSSHTDFVRPVAGDNLGISLKRALGATDLVVLIFTAEGPDWSWCMWECGIATYPNDERPTRVVVLQCGDAVPRPYGDQVRVDARSKESLTGFVQTVLTTKDYFPEAEAALTRFSAESRQVREFAEDLHAELGAVLATLEHQEVEERHACSYLCIQLDRDTVRELRALGECTPQAVELVRKEARIVDRRGVDGLFKFRIDGDTRVGALIDRWAGERRYQGIDDPATARWPDAVLRQIIAVTSGRFPLVAWAPFAVEPGRAVIPMITGSRSVPATGGLALQLYFVPMSPRPVPVTERMIRLEHMFHIDLSETPGETIRLVDLLVEMKADGRSRVPMLGEDSVPKFMVHRSMIERFISERVLLKDGDVRSLTVHDLLVDSHSATMFQHTFAVVDRTADMDRALAAMNAVAGCQDVFVTADGTAAGAVTGWLTNTMFTS